MIKHCSLQENYLSCYLLLVSGIMSCRSDATVCHAGSQDNGIRIFKVQVPDKTSEQTSRSPPSIELLHYEAAAHASDVNCVRWHPKKLHLLASSSDDNSLRIWHVDVPQTI